MTFDPDVVIRRADRADLDDVVNLRLDFLCGVRDRALDQLDPELHNATRTFVEGSHAQGTMVTWLATDAGIVAGLVSMLVRPLPPLPEGLSRFEGYVINMYVVPEHRQRGVGRKLLAACLAAGPALGVSHFVLSATADGRPLYESAGFASDDNWLKLRR